MVVVWLICWLLCWRMGRDSGRNGLVFGAFGPVGVLMLALLPSRKPPGAAVRRLEAKGYIGLAARRRNLNVEDPSLRTLQGGWADQIREDVTEGDGASETE